MTMTKTMPTTKMTIPMTTMTTMTVVRKIAKDDSDDDHDAGATGAIMLMTGDAGARAQLIVY